MSAEGSGGRGLHAAFQIGIVLKGLNAAIECIAALALLFVSHDAIVSFAAGLVHGEIAEDPKDFVAGRLMQWAAGFSVGAQHFATFYLATHGVVKLILVWGLIRDRAWAYPAALAVLGLFIAYQLYRLTFAPSWGLVVLTVFDAVIIALIWNEARTRRARPA